MRITHLNSTEAHSRFSSSLRKGGRCLHIYVLIVLSSKEAWDMSTSTGGSKRTCEMVIRLSCDCDALLYAQQAVLFRIVMLVLRCSAISPAFDTISGPTFPNDIHSKSVLEDFKRNQSPKERNLLGKGEGVAKNSTTDETKNTFKNT